jgi:hypothetical protein
MHPAFDLEYEIEHEVVYYGHHPLAPLEWARELGLGPVLTNAGTDMARVVAFLGSGRVIVTSSYHGVYWGRLLGRTVVPQPRGSKFWHLPPAGPGMLEDHRALNRTFHQAALSLLEAE